LKNTSALLEFFLVDLPASESLLQDVHGIAATGPSSMPRIMKYIIATQKISNSNGPIGTQGISQ
jgi:hypothetical protein